MQSGHANAEGFQPFPSCGSILPEPHTDFIFAVTAGNTGFIGCILVLLAYAILLFRLITGGPALGFPIDLILPAAVLNAALTGVLLYPARMLARRLTLEEKAAW